MGAVSVGLISSPVAVLSLTNLVWVTKVEVDGMGLKGVTEGSIVLLELCVRAIVIVVSVRIGSTRERIFTSL